MILCLCKAVSDRTIRSTVRQGARSVREIAAATGAGTDCGSCACDVRRILRETQQAPGEALPLAAK